MGVRPIRFDLKLVVTLGAAVSAALSSHCIPNVESIDGSAHIRADKTGRPLDITHFTGGYGGAIASVIWTQSVFLLADFTLDEPMNLQKLRNSYDIVTTADTSWAHPYMIASWMLPQLPNGSTRDAIPYLETGARRFPDHWQLRLTWAQYVLESKDIDSIKAQDSATAILLPLSASRSRDVPEYARDLAFTLLHKSGKPEEAMSLLLRTYAQVPDPMVRYQFRGKMGDLLRRNQVSLGADSADFLGGIASLLESKDMAERRVAGQLLTDLVDSARRERALDAAHQLAGQYAAFRKR